MNVIFDTNFYLHCIWVIITILFFVILPVKAVYRSIIYLIFLMVVSVQILLNCSAIKLGYSFFEDSITSNILASVYVKGVWVTLVLFNLLIIACFVRDKRTKIQSSKE